MRRIMVIDDEINVVRALRRELVQAYPGNALAFDLFDDPRDALMWAREQSVDVAISDQRLPHMDGITLMKALREIQPSAVRLIVSGLSDPALVARARDEAHVLRYIVKPWSTQELLGAFREALGLRDRLLATG